VFLKSLFVGAMDRLSNQRDRVRGPDWPHDRVGAPSKKDESCSSGL
jgi:hypothetical protein